MKKIYLSASTQEKNVGVAGYGTEEDNMFILRDLTEKYIQEGGTKFSIKKNNYKSSTLADIVKDSNSFNPDIHLAFHSNAGVKARGCEVYYSMYNKNGLGKLLATYWYNEVAKVTPTTDRGVKSDSVLYTKGLYELRETKAVAVLMEFFFHSNEEDVKFWFANKEAFAVGTAIAIYNFFGLTYKSKYLYKVYAGAYAQEENAKNQVKKLKEKGFNSYYKKEEV